MIYFDDISIASICSGEVYVPVICRADLTALRQRNVYPMMHFAPARTKAGRNDPASDRTLQLPVYGVFIIRKIRILIKTALIGCRQFRPGEDHLFLRFFNNGFFQDRFRHRISVFLRHLFRDFLCPRASFGGHLDLPHRERFYRLVFLRYVDVLFFLSFLCGDDCKDTLFLMGSQ